MPTLATYLAFDGTTREAFEHYRDVFGGDLHLMTYADMPMEGMPYEPDPTSVAHAWLTLPGGTLAGGDQMPGENLAVRDSIYSLMYQVEDVAEGQRVIDALVAAGGSVAMPFEPAPWGDTYGQVFDKFGVMWHLNATTADAGGEGQS